MKLKLVLLFCTSSSIIYLSTLFLDVKFKIMADENWIQCLNSAACQYSRVWYSTVTSWAFFGSSLSNAPSQRFLRIWLNGFPRISVGIIFSAPLVGYCSVHYNQFRSADAFHLEGKTIVFCTYNLHRLIILVINMYKKL